MNHHIPMEGRSYPMVQLCLSQSADIPVILLYTFTAVTPYAAVISSDYSPFTSIVPRRDQGYCGGFL